MELELLTGFTPPFSLRRTAVYNLIEDSEGKSLCFSCMHEAMDSNARKLVAILNSAHGFSIASDAEGGK